jgi:hypothetical protein
MTQTAAPVIGLGAVLSIGTQGGSPTYAAVGKIKTIKAPQPKFGTEDTTTIDTAGGVRTFIKTLQDPGEMDVSVLWESADAGQVSVLAAFNTLSNSANGAAYPFKLALPIDLPGGQTTTGDTFTFNALVTEYTGPEVQADKTITWSFKCKLSGAITFAEGA